MLVESAPQSNSGPSLLVLSTAGFRPRDRSPVFIVCAAGSIDLIFPIACVAVVALLPALEASSEIPEAIGRWSSQRGELALQPQLTLSSLLSGL